MTNYARAIVMEDWTTVRAFYADDAEYVDRRAGLRVQIAGADKIVDAVRTFADREDVAVEIEILASDGDDHGIGSMTYAGVGGAGGGEWEANRLVLARFEDGLLTSLALFDDVLDALTEMLSGHLADGGGEFEGDVLCLIELDGDVVVRLRIFEPDDLERVADSFDELAS